MAKTKKPKRHFPRVKYRRHRKSHKIPILPLVGLAPPMLNLSFWAGTPLMNGDWQGAIYNGTYSLLKDFTGYDLNEKKWTGGNMVATYGSLLMGYVGHVLAGKFGANRAIAKIPIVGKWIEL